MEWMAVAAACALVVFGAWLVLKRKRSQAYESAGDLFLYRKRSALFSPAERSFLGVLDLAISKKEFRVFGKVRISDVLTPSSASDRSAFKAALNKINSKHFDFVLCKPGELNVLCAIELNDASHQRKDRQERDGFVMAACRGAGLPLIQFDAQHAYTPGEVNAKIAEAISGVVSMSSQSPLSEPLPDEAPAGETAPRCPRCYSKMIKRVAKGGDNVGKEFWGCSNFPKCREIVTI